jgi:hypothetical protein
VARALQLDDVERAHLRRLARPEQEADGVLTGTQEVRPGLRRLMEMSADGPAYVVGRAPTSSRGTRWRRRSSPTSAPSPGGTGTWLG